MRSLSILSRYVLTLSALFALRLTQVTGTSAKPKLYYSLLGLHTLDTTVTSPITNFSDALARFRDETDPELHTYISPFNISHWNVRGPTVIRALANHNFPLFLAWIAGGVKKLVPSVADLPAYARGSFKRAMSAWSGSHMQACQSDRCIRMLEEILDNGYIGLFKMNAWESMSGIQMKALIRRVMDPAAHQSLTSFKTSIPQQVLQNFSPLIVSEMGDRFPTLLGKESVRKVLHGKRELEACRNLSRDALEQMIRTSMGDLITADCLMARELVAPVFNTLEVPQRSAFHIDGRILKKYNNGLHPTTYPYLEWSHITNYAAEVPDSKLPGKDLRLDLLPDKLLPRLPLRLLIGKLHSQPGKAVLLGRKARKLSATIFENVSSIDAYTALSKLEADDWVSLPPKAIQSIVDNHPAVCKFLRPENMKEISLHNPLCFRYMHPWTQASALMDAKSISGELFVKIDMSAILNWYYRVKEREFKGFSVLGARTSSKAPFDQLIPRLGEDPDGESPCRGLDNLNQILQTPPLWKNITVPCLLEAEIGLPTEGAEFKALPDRMKYMFPFTQLCKLYDDKFFQNLTPEQFSHLVKGRDFCRNVDVKTIKLIPSQDFGRIDLQCWIDMPQEIKEAFSPEQASYVPKTVISGLIDGLSSEDLQRMSTVTLRGALDNATVGGPEGPTKNIGRLFTARFFRSHDDLSMIRPDHWAACPLTAFEGIDRDVQLASIPAESMTNWREDMVKAVPAIVMKSLGEGQAEKIGLDTPPEISPLKYLLELHQLDPKVKAVLLQRQSDKSHWVWIVGVSVGIVGILAIAVPITNHLINRRPREAFL